MADSDLVLSILEGIFGDWKNHNPISGQISFDCPVCSYDIKGLEKGDGKGNLEINYRKNIYKCWACSDTNNTQGRLRYLISRWGSPSEKKLFALAVPEKYDGSAEVWEDLVMPEGYVTLLDGNVRDFKYMEAVRYLKKRGITREHIEKFRMGYTTQGKYSHRIIVPSYDIKDELNYFVARSYVPTKLKYKNPKVQKEKVIFNEFNVKWDEDIYLVEGVFDMFFLPNAIPLLGKIITDHLWNEIYDKAKGDIILCLDGDAWGSTVKLYAKLNGGVLRGRVKVLVMPEDKDIGDMRGDISELEIIELEK